MVAYILLLCFSLFSFSIFCEVGHLKFFHKYFNYVNFAQKVQYFIYTLQRAQIYVFIHTNRKWCARIGTFNLNRTYFKKIKVPRLPLTNCHFSVLFFQFLFYYYQAISSFKLQKLLLLINYVLVMYSFNLHHFLLLEQVILKSIQVL